MFMCEMSKVSHFNKVQILSRVSLCDNTGNEHMDITFLRVTTMSKHVISAQCLTVLLHLTMSGWDYSSLMRHVNMQVCPGYYE